MMTARSRPIIAVVLAAGLLLAVTASVWAGASYEPPPRYPVKILNEPELLRVFAAGLVGDAFGYDANEILYQVRATGMPVEDIVPSFYVAYLTGKNFLEVVGLRSDGMTWGAVAEELDLSADTLNRMAIPKAIGFTDPGEVPDDVLQDMFVCSALSYVFDIDPEDIFAYYELGWSSIDVLAAMNLAFYTQQPLDTWLDETPRRIDWYVAARRADVDLGQIAATSGRVLDNLLPVMADEPQRSDLETIYAMEMASDYWDVPIETVRRVRYRYLYCPSEVLVTFYLSHIGHVDYFRIGGLYSWNHWRRWGPTIVALRIPPSHFSGWSIWHGGPVSFHTVDTIVLHDHLLGHALSYGRHVPVRIYEHYDPWFGPHDAILYCGVYRHYRVPFHDFYSWRRNGRPWHAYHHFGKNYVEWRRNTDFVGRRRVGAIVGSKKPVHAAVGPGRAAPSGHYSARPAGHGYSVSGRRVGTITGKKTHVRRPTTSPRVVKPAPGRTHGSSTKAAPPPNASRGRASRYGKVVGIETGQRSDQRRTGHVTPAPKPQTHRTGSGAVSGPRTGLKRTATTPKVSTPKPQTHRTGSGAVSGPRTGPKRTSTSPKVSAPAPKQSTRRYGLVTPSPSRTSPKPTVTAPRVSTPPTAKPPTVSHSAPSVSSSRGPTIGFGRRTSSAVSARKATSPAPSTSRPSESSRKRFWTGSSSSRSHSSSPPAVKSSSGQSSGSSRRYGLVTGSKSSSSSSKPAVSKPRPSSTSSVSTQRKSSSSTSRRRGFGRRRR